MATIRLTEARLSATGAVPFRLDPGMAIEGMLVGTTVRTLEGSFPVEYLSVGDRVVTRGGASRLTGIEITVVRNARVVRIAADTPGLETPQDTVTVAAAQTVLLHGWRAKAVSGTDQALVAAGRLCDGRYITAETLGEARLFKLTFTEAAVIYAGGLLLACERTKICA